MNATNLRSYCLNLLSSHFDFKKSFYTFRDAHISAHKSKLQLKFLRDCLENCIIPKSLLPNRLMFTNNNPFPEAAKEILLEYIERVNLEVDANFRKVRHSFKIFESSFNRSGCSDDDFYKLTQYVFYINSIKSKQTQIRLMNKFEGLFQNSPWFKYSNPDNVKNLSSTLLTLDQLVVLGYGLSFSLPPSKDDVLEFLTSYSKFEYFNTNSNEFLPQDFSTLKGFILNSLYRELNNGKKIPKRFHQAISYLKQNNDLIICKADKGGKVVVMDKRIYNEKMEQLLRDDNTYQLINSNPLKKWQQVFNKQLKIILKDFPELESKFKAFMPSLPRMYGLPKLHKENVPMRPIVSTNNSSEYKLCSWISKRLSSCTNKICNTSLVNSLDFKEKINSVNHKDKIISSFDIKSLFTNIPTYECIDLLSRELPNLNLDIPVPLESFMKLIKLSVSNCYFSFNNKFYLQMTGLPMGNPLSPILANIFLEFYERDKLSTILDINTITWLRYVDDVFAVVPNTTNFDHLLEQINSLHSSIQFTFELEHNNSLPFLDTLVIKDLINSRFIFQVYRKPTHSNAYIHSFSHHSLQVKMGTIVNIFLRAYNICSPQFLNDEINYIFDVFKSLAYSINYIHKAHMNARKVFYKTSNRNKTDFSKVLVLPFSSELSIVNKLLSKNNIQIVNRTTKTISLLKCILPHIKTLHWRVNQPR